MFSKVSLIEQANFIDKVPSVLPIDFDKLKNNIIKNYGFRNVQNESDWSYLNQYYNLDDDINITWLHDYIRDHYRLKTGKNPVFLQRAGLLQNYQEEINFHHHLDDYDLEGSPDISAIITINCGKEPTFVEFEYEGGRKRHMKHRIEFENKQIIIFNSELRHRFSKNINKEPLINLSFKFQLI